MKAEISSKLHVIVQVDHAPLVVKIYVAVMLAGHGYLADVQDAILDVLTIVIQKMESHPEHVADYAVSCVKKGVVNVTVCVVMHHVREYVMIYVLMDVSKPV